MRMLRGDARLFVAVSGVGFAVAMNKKFEEGDGVKNDTETRASRRKDKDDRIVGNING